MLSNGWEYDFASWFLSDARFPGLLLESHDLTSNATLDAMSTDGITGFKKLKAGYENLGNASNPPTAESLDAKTINVLAVASGGGLSDSATYKMRVRPPVKQEELLWTYSNAGQYMHNIHKVHAEVTFDGATWPPHFAARFPYGNVDTEVGYTVSQAFAFTKGYVHTVENSNDLTSGQIKIGYKTSYAETQSFTATYSESGSLGKVPLKSGTYVEFWTAYTGIAQLYYGSRWGLHGFEGDAKDLTALNVDCKPTGFAFPISRPYSIGFPGDTP